MSSAHPEPSSFVPRHLGPSDAEVRAMLDALNYPTLDAFIDATIPASIRFRDKLNIPAARSEQDALASFATEMSVNEVWRSYIGMGY